MSMTAPILSGPVINPGDIAVRIIFVPDGIGAGQRGPNGLPTEQQLTAAKTHVTDATNGTLKQRDVIVFAGLPWHYADGKLREHSVAHHDFPGTFLLLTVERDKAVWWSDLEFDIATIEPDDHGHVGSTIPGPPSDGAPYPFTQVPVTRPEDDAQLAAAKIHVARSTVAVAGARGHDYKVTFRRNGQDIDPNMRCH